MLNNTLQTCYEPATLQLVRLVNAGQDMANEQNFAGVRYWPLQDAKAKLSELVKTVITDGPQGISIHGKQEVIMLSKQEFDSLTQPKQNFAQFMQASPLANTELEIKRDKSLTRDTEL